MSSILYSSAKKIIEAIHTKQISSEEVVNTYLARIEEINPKLNAVVQTNPEEAIKQARLVDQELAQGKTIKKLHGLPVTIKDCCDVKGFICTTGTLGYSAYKAHRDATCVARLRAEGAIILGLTNMAELGAAFETDNLVYGRTLNPYDLSRTPGGSTGGEAAIIAAGGSPLGLGADGGGSIRVPSHFCGIAGIKPTQGRVPLTGLLIPKDGVGLVNQIGTFGMMARYVEDLILSLPIISGPDGIDNHIAPVPFFDIDNIEMKGLRVAFYADNGLAKPTTETIVTIQQAAKVLAELGSHVEEIKPVAMSNTFQLLWGVFFEGGDGGVGLQELLPSIGSEQHSPILQRFLTRSAQNKLSVKELHGLLAEVDHFRTRLQTSLNSYDIIICPACATPAKEHGTTFDNLLDFTYTMTYNLMGWPGTVVRCGTSSEGLPIGVQVIAKAWQDNLSLAVASKLEAVLGGWFKPKI